MVSYILAAITGILMLGADQFTKYYISHNFVKGESYKFLPGFIDITYIHNDGGAWGMLGGYTWVLLSVTIVIMLVCIALLLKTGIKDKLMFWAITLILSGGIGNMIDRVFRDGNVIDFLHFEFWYRFPVFNVADCVIVVGAGLMLFYFFKEMIRESLQKRAELKKRIAEKRKNEEN